MAITVLRLRVDENLNKEASELSHNLGFTLSDVVRMFLAAFVNEQKIPFTIEKPNEETIRAMEEAKESCTTKYSSFGELMDEIDRESSFEKCSISK